jgi:hypothetical protein
MSERTLPTRPGWWLVDVSYLPEAVPANVLDGLELCRIWGEKALLDTDDVRLSWLAPIPSPDTCAIVAEYAERLADKDALGNPDGAMHDMNFQLQETLRAERAEVTE